MMLVRLSHESLKLAGRRSKTEKKERGEKRRGSWRRRKSGGKEDGKGNDEYEAEITATSSPS